MSLELLNSNDIIEDTTFDEFSLTITADGTDTDFVKAFDASGTGSTEVEARATWNNIKFQFYGVTGTDSLTSLWSSNTGEAAAVFSVKNETIKDAIVPGSFTADIGSSGEQMQIIDIEDNDTTPSSSLPTYHGKLVDASSTSDVFGEIFYNYGVVVLHGMDVASSGSDLATQLKIATTAAEFEYGSTASPTGAQVYIENINFRYKERQAKQIFFIRALNNKFNFSSNSTFSDDVGNILDSLTADPTTYITSVGLYNEDNELIAVAKTSQPIQKTFNDESLIKVTLSY